MTDQTKYTHIKVNSASRDEEVIVVGQPSSSANATSAPQAQVVDAVDEGAIASSAPEEDQGPATSDEAKPSPKASRSAYDPTTLEDVTSSRMPTIQKVILVVALLAVAAFIVYSVAF